MLTGPVTTSPREQESNVLAVINHAIPARGCLPPACAGRGPLVSSLWGGPHLIPRVDDAPVLPRRARITGDAAFPSEVTTAVRGLRPAGGGTFRISFAGRREFGDQTTRDITDGLPSVVGFHVSKHGASNGREVVKHSQG